ncbi:MAG TPA: EcsC family protein [Xanthobacteraceae bacterium]|nr:EcsC family protein [Xanthobacteraceae bacterium]
MSLAESTAVLPPQQLQVLEEAVRRLEDRGFAAKLADYAGQPVAKLLRMMPGAASTRFNKAVEAAMLKCLNAAIRSLGPGAKRRPAHRASSVLVGLSGGVSGFFGLAALPIELPVTTTLMLRAIADIARHYGEDLSTLEARLACMEVFALGAPEDRSHGGRHLGYYASRVFLGRLTADTAALLLERGLASVSAPLVGGLISEIATRFGVVVSERSAASAMPVLGALGGATVNVVFMNHFQSVAQGHFAIRRLERDYGFAVVRRLYEEIAPRHRRAAGE